MNFLLFQGSVTVVSAFHGSLSGLFFQQESGSAPHRAGPSFLTAVFSIPSPLLPAILKPVILRLPVTTRRYLFLPGR
jgi:hypothetical protein